MTYVQHIIDKFGGVRATASAIGFPPSTVQGWKNRGSIPDERKPIVLEAATRKGIALTPLDFWPEPAAGAA